MWKEYKGLVVYKNGNIKKNWNIVGWVYKHWYVGISVGNKQETAHSIIMKLYVWPRPKWYDINHKNWNKQDNRLCNLEYCTRKENIKHSFKTKLQVVPKWKDNHMYWKLNHWSSKKVYQYTSDLVLLKEWASTNEIARQLWYSAWNINSVCNWKRPKAHWYLWRRNII